MVLNFRFLFGLFLHLPSHFPSSWRLAASAEPAHLEGTTVGQLRRWCQPGGCGSFEMMDRCSGSAKRPCGWGRTVHKAETEQQRLSSRLPSSLQTSHLRKRLCKRQWCWLSAATPRSRLGEMKEERWREAAADCLFWGAACHRFCDVCCRCWCRLTKRKRPCLTTPRLLAPGSGQRRCDGL